MSQLTPAARPYLWKPGQSGNPSGRPKSSFSIAALARSYGPEAVETLVDLMRNSSDDGIRGRSAVALLDRGFGKPKEEISMELERPNPSPEERIAMLAEIARRLGYEFRPARGTIIDETA